jgi:hypothetical protein
MPCDQVITNTVDLGHIGDLDMLERALKAKYQSVYRRGSQFSFSVNGYGVSLSDGRLSSQLSERTLQGVVSEIKQSYSCETVVEAANQFGWLIEEDEEQHVNVRH